MQTIHLLPNTPWVIENDNNVLTAFVLQCADTCFFQLDIIAILPLFSIWAPSIFVAALSDLSETQSQAVRVCVMLRHKMQLRMRERATGSVQRLLILLFTSCVTRRIQCQTLVSLPKPCGLAVTN